MPCPDRIDIGRKRPAPRTRRLACAAMIVFALLAGSVALGEETPVDRAIAEGARALSAGDLEAAERAFVRATELDPASTAALLKLGITRSQRRDWEGAVSAYERLLALEPRNAQALNNMANVWFRQDVYDKAAEFYGKALEIDPNYLLAIYHLGWIQRHENDNDAAETSFRHCLDLTAKSDRERATQLDCRFYLGTLRFRASAWADTASLMEQVLQAYPGHTEARYYLGTAYMRLGRREEGREQLEIHRRMLEATRRSDPIESPDQP